MREPPASSSRRTDARLRSAGERRVEELVDPTLVVRGTLLVEPAVAGRLADLELGADAGCGGRIAQPLGIGERDRIVGASVQDEDGPAAEIADGGDRIVAKH